MAPKKNSVFKRKARDGTAEEEEEGEDYRVSARSTGTSSTAVQDELKYLTKKRADERTSVLQRVRNHEKEHTRCIKEIDSRFRENVNEAFMRFKQTELCIEEEIERYIVAFAHTVEAVQMGLKNVLRYMDQRHGDAGSVQHEQAYKDFVVLLENQIKLLQSLAAKREAESQAKKSAIV